MKKHAVLIISTIIVLLVVISGILLPDQIENITVSLQAWISDTFGWYYLLLVTALLFVCLYFLVSPTIGKIKLGKSDEEPEFSIISWLGMLFSAGMGMSLMFFGAAEPLSHYAIQSPTGETETPAAVTDALSHTFFHWGLHGWTPYCIMALGMAFHHFRKDRPGLISSALQPVFGSSIEGFAGKMIDIIAVFATVIGIATTLGFGSTQINSGLSYIFGLSTNFFTQVIIVIIMTILFIISAWSGLQKGIRYLSNVNMILFGAIFFMMLAVGPTLYLFNLFTESLGAYLQNLPGMSFRSSPHDADIRGWINDWTIFYWAWWMAWSSFVGIFIARVSRGRTVREFISAVLVVPPIVCFLWFTVYGGSAIYFEQAGADLASLPEELVLFGLYSNVGFGMLISIIALILMAVFFITSADSASFVLGMLTTNGSSTPPNRVKLLWGVLVVTTTLVLLYFGGLQAYENALIIVALPLSAVIILMTLGLIFAMKKEAKKMKES